MYRELQGHRLKNSYQSALSKKNSVCEMTFFGNVAVKIHLATSSEGRKYSQRSLTKAPAGSFLENPVRTLIRLGADVARDRLSRAEPLSADVPSVNVLGVLVAESTKLRTRVPRFRSSPALFSLGVYRASTQGGDVARRIRIVLRGEANEFS